MNIEPDRLTELAKIVEAHLPETCAYASEDWHWKVEGRSTRISDMHARTIYLISELSPEALGLSRSAVDNKDLVLALRSARTALFRLSKIDRQNLLIAVDPGRNQTECFGRVEELIDELRDLEFAAGSKQFERMKGGRANAKRNWRAATIAFASQSVWTQVRGDGSVPMAVNHDAPSAFGKFLNDILKWANEKASAAVALRSLRAWQRSQ